MTALSGSLTILRQSRRSLNQKIKSLENAYSKGASMVLLLQSDWQKSMELSRSISYVELSVHPEFTEHFIDNLDFPDTYLW